MLKGSVSDSRTVLRQSVPRGGPRGVLKRRNMPRAASGIGGSLAPQQFMAVLGLLMIVVFRLHELLPTIVLIVRPALLVGVLGIVVLYGSASISQRKNALHDVFWQRSLLYFTWALVTVPFALWKGGALDRVIGFLPLAMMVFCFSLLPASVRSLDQIGNIFITAGSLLAIGALVGAQSIAGRLTATFSFDPNSLAAMMAITLPFALMSAYRHRGGRRLVLIAVTALLLWVLLKTQSRGSLLGAVAAVGVLIASLRSRQKLVAILVTGLAAILFWLVSPAELKSRLSTMASIGEDYNTTARGGRVQIWQRGLSYIISNPVFGVGPANFEAAEGEYNRENQLTGKWSAPHNAIIEAFAELGIPGGLLFLLLMVTAFRVAIKLWPAKSSVWRPEITAALTALSVCGIFLGLAYFWGLFALLGICSVAGRVKAG